MVKYVLGYDLGTSYFKASLINEKGRNCGIGRGRSPKTTNGGIVTITPEAFWKGVRECTTEALHKAGIEAQDICGISYGSQANTFLLLDSFGEPLTDLYVWTSVFESPKDCGLKALWESEEFQRTTGIGFSGGGGLLAKLVWIRENMPEIWKRTAKVMTISDYLLYGLTGSFITDASTSALLGHLDIHEQQWWHKALAKVDMDPSLFPKVVPMGTKIGLTTSNCCPKTGLVEGIPVFAGGLDHVVAACGAGIGTFAELSESTGTVLACLAIRPGATTQPELLIGPALVPGEYSYLAYSNAGAEVIEELHAKYHEDLSIDDMLALVHKSVPGAHGLIYNDEKRNQELESRFFKPDTSRKYSAADYVRAIVEALTYRLWRLSQQVTEERSFQSIVATGGANRSLDLLQVKADFFGAEVLFGEQVELGTFGAAMIAAVGCGWYDSLGAVQAAWIKIARRVYPKTGMHELYQKWIAQRETL